MRRAINVPGRGVEGFWLDEERAFPLVLQANSSGCDPAMWMTEHRSWIDARLRETGAVLWRGFALSSNADFKRISDQLCNGYASFDEESSPRHVVWDVVQTATDYPAEYPIQFHNEFSYAQSWPLKLLFFCRQPATTGGQTPIADSRRVLASLSTATRRKFEDKQILYRRTYRPFIGVSWHVAFRTTDRAEVERRCRALHIEFTWRSPDCLMTSHRAPAVVRHPDSGEAVWFNHAFFFSVHSLEPMYLRNAMLALPQDDLSTNTYYGDGSPIEAATIEEIRTAYEGARVSFDWRAGDVLLLDNMLTSHSRAPFTGTRELLTIMADPCSRKICDATVTGTGDPSSASLRSTASAV